MDEEQQKQTKPDPQPDVLETVTPAPVEPTVGGRKKKTGLVVSIIIILLIIAAGVGFGVYYYLTNTPENLMKAAVNNLSKQSTVSTQYELAGDSVLVSGDFAYASDSSNTNNSEVIFSVNVDDVSVNARALSLGDNLYIKASGLGSLGSIVASMSGTTDEASIAQYVALFETLDSRWISVTSDDINSIASTDTGVEGVPTKAEIDQVVSIYNKHSFIKSDTVFADETVDGNNCAHFSIKFDKTEAVAFLQAVQDANLTNVTVTDENITELQNSDMAIDGTVELWIARNSKTFKKIVVDSTAEDAMGSLTLTFTSTTPSFDAFTTPSGASSITDIFTEFYSSFYTTETIDSSTIY